MPPPSSSPPPPPILLTHDDLSYTSAALPTPTMRLLTQHLRHSDALADLNNLLNDSLARTGWTDRVRALALELLRSGQATSFPDLLGQVMTRARVPKIGETLEEKEKDKKTNGAAGGKGGKGVVNGSTTTTAAAAGRKSVNGAGVNGSSAGGGGSQNSAVGNGAISVREGWFGPDGLPDVRIPVSTVEEGVDFLKEKIADVVEVVLDDDDH